MKRFIGMLVLLFCVSQAFGAAHVLSRSAKYAANAGYQNTRYAAKKTVQGAKVAKKAGVSLFKAIF